MSVPEPPKLLSPGIRRSALSVTSFSKWTRCCLGYTERTFYQTKDGTLTGEADLLFLPLIRVPQPRGHAEADVYPVEVVRCILARGMCGASPSGGVCFCRDHQLCFIYQTSNYQTDGVLFIAYIRGVAGPWGSRYILADGLWGSTMFPTRVTV